MSRHCGVPPELLDPLGDWPRVDPQPDRIQAAIDDLTRRANSWGRAVGHTRAAAAVLDGSHHVGRAADLERAALARFADACTGVNAALLIVAAALDAYLAAFEAYRDQMRRAHAVANASIAEVTATLRAHQVPYGTIFPDTALRVRARQLAEAALETFAQAGLAAARTVADQAATLTSGWTDTARSCTWIGAATRVVSAGRAVESVPGGISSVLAGAELVGRSRSISWTDRELRELAARAVNAANALAVKEGRHAEASGVMRVAVAGAQRLGASVETLGRIGHLAMIGGMTSAVGTDAVTLVTAAGETGAHAAVTRAAAGLNAAAIVRLGGRLAADGLADFAEAPMPALLAATAAYQLGDLVYSHRKGLVAAAEEFLGHRRPKRLP